MFVQITHMKAPWPQGATVGSVVEVDGDSIPAFFVGKCVQAPEGSQAEHRFVPQPPPAVRVTAPGAAPAQAAEDLAIAQRMLAEAQAAQGELIARVEKAEDALDGKTEELASMATKVTELEAEAERANGELTGWLNDARAATGQAMNDLAVVTAERDRLLAELEAATKPAEAAPAAKTKPTGR